MSLLLNKRKRDETSNDSNLIPNDNTSKNNQENISSNNQEELLEENNLDIIQKNSKYDAFQMMFRSINSRQDDINKNMILSPLCSNLFFGSFQKIKNFDKLAASNVKSGVILSKSNSSFINNKKGKMFLSPENNFNFETLFNNNNNDKMKINLDLDLFNISDKKNIFYSNIDNRIN